MDVLLNLSPLIKLVGTFILTIVLIKSRVSLGTALMTSSILLGFWFGLSPLQIGASIMGSLIAQQTVMLFVVVMLILALSHAMDRTGQMKRLLDSFKGISQNARLNLALFPALIGLLPMPGGAIFSAPMVGEISDQETLSGEHKTLINYWFRHIWEFCWPLYPGVILTCALSGIDMWTFILAQFPLTLFTAFVGYLTQLRTVPIQDHPCATNSNKPLMSFLTELMPILLVVVGTVSCGVMIYIASYAWPTLKFVSKEIPLIVALIIGLLWVWRQNHMRVGDVQPIFLNRSLLSMTFMIASVMVFQGVLENTGAISEISQQLTSARVPLILLVVALPFFVGSITGITVAFVGITFPIIFSLLVDAGMASHIRAYTVLAFCAGYLGVLLSPLHICLILTCTYFKTDLARIYPRLSLLCLALAAAGALSFWINLLI